MTKYLLMRLLLGVSFMVMPTAAALGASSETVQGDLAKKSRAETPLSDRTILFRLHQHCQFAAAAGQLAEERGNAPDIKEFGERLAKDYKVADLKVRALAARLTIR